MEGLLELMKNEVLLFGMLIAILILFILYIVTIIKFNNVKKNYNEFMKKLGKGENIQTNIEDYMKRIEKVEKEHIEIKSYCQHLEQNIRGCIQKIGLVRYNAFKDTGSDLSFALALLDENNSGVVLNGIYSRETSNIYSKPVEKGTSSYTLSEEEKVAIQKAINQ